MTARQSRRFLITLPALVLLIVGLLLILRPSGKPYLDLLRQGDEHAAAAERTAAVAAYREAARLRPDDPSPYLRLGRTYLDWGRTEEALDAAAMAERLGAEGADLERLWLAVHVARSDWLVVVERAQRLLTLAPRDREARHALARAYLELREWDAARSAYRALARSDPADAVAHERLGALLLGDDPAAVRHLLVADTELSKRLFAAAEEALPVGDPAYTGVLLGRELLAHQEWALAVYRLERALSHNAAYPDAHAYLGHALDQMGHPEEAGRHLRRAVALAPESAVAHTLLGLHHDRAGDIAAARAAYETAYDLAPDNPAICVEIGQTWMAEGRYVAAEVWLREAVSLRPNDPGLWEILARFYLNHNIASADRAVEAAEELIELSPDDAQAHDLRGWAALQDGDYVTAQRHLRRAIELDPTLASAYYRLGLLRRAEGRPQEAEEAFTRALDLDTSGELVAPVERARGKTSN